jgi:hypothetical protein
LSFDTLHAMRENFSKVLMSAPCALPAAGSWKGTPLLIGQVLDALADDEVDKAADQAQRRLQIAGDRVAEGFQLLVR